jgi:hypothetical protein
MTPKAVLVLVLGRSDRREHLVDQIVILVPEFII